MPRPSPDALRAAQEFRLVLFEAPPRGVAGERLGKGTGSSLEFQDRRSYAIGDDVRHLDWRSFARTDQLLVRQYREEVLPRVEIVLDVSRSMAIDETKAQVAIDIVTVIAGAGRGDGFQVEIALARVRPELVDFERFAREGAEIDERESFERTLPTSLEILRRGSMRVLVSDFLFPHDAAEFVRPLAARAGGLALIQIVGTSDRAPEVGTALRLVDAESDEARDLVLDEKTVQRYYERMTRLTDGLETECRRAGARFVSIDAASAIGTICRSRLVPAGVLGVG
ncbi:MAG: DUF58 domain-containing protein [Planctomycetota bacterium]|nr:DUF58 domain-containing protein [Planctomycetota bacterium]